MKPFPWEVPSKTIAGLPTFRGAEARRELVRRYGLPNAAPREGGSLFGRCRELFVDDDHDGRPVAYWVPDKPEGD